MTTLLLTMLGAFSDEVEISRGVTRLLDKQYGVICYIGRTDKKELVSFWCIPVNEGSLNVSTPTQSRKPQTLDVP